MIVGLFERAELLELVHTSVHFCVRVGSAAYTFAVRVVGTSAASVTSCKNFLPLLGNECNWVKTIDSRAALSVCVGEGSYRWLQMALRASRREQAHAHSSEGCTRLHE